MTAIFGGAFDPPHIGHIKAIEGLKTNPGVGHIVVMPNGKPPWKSDATDPTTRLELAELAFKDLHSVEVSRTEVDRPGTSTTLETLQELSQEEKNLAWVIGSDQLVDLHRWKGFPQILGLCHWIVLGRKPIGMLQGLAVLKQWEKNRFIMPIEPDRTWLISGQPTTLTLVETRAPALSSSQIRDWIASGDERAQAKAETAVPKAAWQRLKGLKLYGS